MPQIAIPREVPNSGRGRVSGFTGQGDPEPAIRQQLDRVLESKIFIQSDRLSRFLRFIVEHALAGNQDYLKEYVIGSEVYDRTPPYHPSQDSIVRTEARRLRSKLKEYYVSIGNEDPVYIYLRPGNYRPIFQWRDKLVGDPTAINITHNSPTTQADVVTIAILPFTDITGSQISSTYALGIPDELAYMLMSTEGYRVVPPFSTSHLSLKEHDLTAMIARVSAQVALTGSVREESNHIRVTATIVDPAGYQVWARRFDADAGALALFTIEEQIASALSVGLQALLSDAEPAAMCFGREA